MYPDQIPKVHIRGRVSNFTILSIDVGRCGDSVKARLFVIQVKLTHMGPTTYTHGLLGAENISGFEMTAWGPTDFMCIRCFALLAFARPLCTKQNKNRTKQIS